MSEIRIKRLVYSDLPSVLSIERRSFQTPWSLAMFVLELSKPSGICLAVTDDEGRPALLTIGPVQRGECLSTSRIQDGQRFAVAALGGLAHSPREGVERAHRGDRLRQRLSERPRRRQADPHAGEGPRADPGRDHVHSPPAARPIDHELHLREEGARVTGATGRGPGEQAVLDHLAVPCHGDREVGRCGVPADYRGHGSGTAIVIRRRSPPSWLMTTRTTLPAAAGSSAPMAASAASGHSTKLIASSVR